MNLLLSISADKYNTPLNFSEALGFGGQMVLIGMLAVFAVLILLWICLTVFKLFFHDIPAKRSVTQKAVQAPVAMVKEVVPTSSEGEIVAVIAAAIAMAESENSGMKFKVVSFKRK